MANQIVLLTRLKHSGKEYLQGTPASQLPSDVDKKTLAETGVLGKLPEPPPEPVTPEDLAELEEHEVETVNPDEVPGGGGSGSNSSDDEDED